MQEIERKFLIHYELWTPQGKGVSIRQGYLSTDPERTVRVRIAKNKSYITIKGKALGIVRTELEYKIPLNEAEVLLKMCTGLLVEKTRYKEEVGGMIWEIDVFEGENRGLVVAEIELNSETQTFEMPPWVMKEVSGDEGYYNSRLAEKPYSTW